MSCVNIHRMCLKYPTFKESFVIIVAEVPFTSVCVLYVSLEVCQEGKYFSTKRAGHVFFLPMAPRNCVSVVIFSSSDVFGISDAITESKYLVFGSTGTSLNSNSLMNNNLGINSCLMWLIS